MKTDAKLTDAKLKEAMPISTREPVNSEEFLGALYKGGELLTAGKIVEARGHLEKAHELAPQNEKAQNLLGLTYFKLGLFDQASGIYERLVRENPADPTLRVNLGLVYLKTNNLSRSIREFETATDLDPEHKKAHKYLGLALAQRGEYARAREHFIFAGSEQMADRMTHALATKIESAQTPSLSPPTITATLSSPPTHRPANLAIAAAPLLPPPSSDEIEVMSESEEELGSDVEELSAPEPGIPPPRDLDDTQPIVMNLAPVMAEPSSTVIVSPEIYAPTGFGPESTAVTFFGEPRTSASTGRDTATGPARAAYSAPFDSDRAPPLNGEAKHTAISVNLSPAEEEPSISAAASSALSLDRDWGAQFGIEETHDRLAGPEPTSRAEALAPEMPMIEAVADVEATKTAWTPPQVRSWNSALGLTPPATEGPDNHLGDDFARMPAPSEEPTAPQAHHPQALASIAAGSEAFSSEERFTSETQPPASRVGDSDETNFTDVVPVEPTATAPQPWAIQSDETTWGVRDPSADAALGQPFISTDPVVPPELPRWSDTLAQWNQDMMAVPSSDDARWEQDTDTQWASASTGATWNSEDASARAMQAWNPGFDGSDPQRKPIEDRLDERPLDERPLDEHSQLGVDWSEKDSRPGEVTVTPLESEPSWVAQPLSQFTPEGTGTLSDAAPFSSSRPSGYTPMEARTLVELSNTNSPLEAPHAGPFHVGPHGLAISVGGEMLSRMSNLVAIVGSVGATAEFRRSRGRSTGAGFGEPPAQLQRLVGHGVVHLETGSSRFHALSLEEGDGAYVREECVFGFEESISFENGRLTDERNRLVLDLVHLAGAGQVLLQLSGAMKSLAIPPGAPMVVPLHRLVGWFGRVAPRLTGLAGQGAVELTGVGYALLMTPG